MNGSAAIEAAAEAATALAAAEGRVVRGEIVTALRIISTRACPTLWVAAEAVADETDDPPGQAVALRREILELGARVDSILAASRPPETVARNRAIGCRARIDPTPLRALGALLEAWVASKHPRPRPPSADVFGEAVHAAGRACEMSPLPVSAEEEAAVLEALRRDPGLRPPTGKVTPVIVTGSDGGRALYMLDCLGQAVRV